MKITRTQLIQIIMEELNEESGDEVRDTLGLCDRYGVGPNDRLVTDKTFGIGVFISQLKKLWIEENRAGMMEHLKDFFDDHNVIADLDWLDCVEWSDTQRAAYAELKEHLIDLGERYRAVHRVLQYTASREHGIQTPEQLDAEKIEDVYAWDHYDDVARLLNQLKWVTTVDVESEPEEPEPFREMKITPTQFKELLLEEVGNCTEPQHVIFSIVRDMDPNDVAELFQDVFEQLPGVEMTRLDPEDEEPIPTSYQPGGELGDRPVVGFKEQLMEMVRQELSEGPWSPYYRVHQAVAKMPGYTDFGNVSIGGGAQRYTFESEDAGKAAKNELSRRFRSFTFHWSDLGQYVQVSGG